MAPTGGGGRGWGGGRGTDGGRGRRCGRGRGGGRGGGGGCWLEWRAWRGARGWGGADTGPRGAHSLAGMKSPLLAVPGAVPAEGPDAGVAFHYGDPYAEQRALSASSGVVDRSHRDVLRITGQDRLSWLHSLTTQHLEQLEPGRTADALILSPNGHI